MQYRVSCNKDQVERAFPNDLALLDFVMLRPAQTNRISVHFHDIETARHYYNKLRDANLVAFRNWME